MLSGRSWQSSCFRCRCYQLGKAKSNEKYRENERCRFLNKIGLMAQKKLLVVKSVKKILFHQLLMQYPLLEFPVFLLSSQPIFPFKPIHVRFWHVGGEADQPPLAYEASLYFKERRIRDREENGIDAKLRNPLLIERGDSKVSILYSKVRRAKETEEIRSCY